MSNEVVISVENVSKACRLGQIGGGTLRADVSRWWAMLRGKEYPNSKIGEKRKLETGNLKPETGNQASGFKSQVTIASRLRGKGFPHRQAGSGDRDSFPNGATRPWPEGFGAVFGQSEPRFGGALRPAESQPQNDPRLGGWAAHPGRRAVGAGPKRLNLAKSDVI